MIDQKKLAKIKNKILKEFPEFKGIKPKMTEQIIKPQDRVYRKLSMGTPKQFRQVYRLQFRRQVKTVDKIAMERILIVTLDECGEIIKVTQSR